MFSAASSLCRLAAGGVLLLLLLLLHQAHGIGADGADVRLAPVALTLPLCGESEVVDMVPRGDWCCDCYHSQASNENEMQCRCMGLALVRLPQKLPATLNQLTVVQANLLKLRLVGLLRFAATLQDIMLTDVPLFETIEPGALGHCRQLRTLYISQAPSLTHLPEDVFAGMPDTFRSLRIINSGLQHIPDMSPLSKHEILQMVDLEGNQIVQINQHAVNINTELFILDNNPIEYVNQSAFDGSKIAKLSLKGNTRLSSMHPAAFAGIVHIQELDLSSTALQVLPTEGLNSLEILRIQNTHTLRTIPSVYHFKNLRVAWLTHPFHCCAFQFPSRHDPQRYWQRQRYLAQQKRECINNGLLPADANATESTADDTAAVVDAENGYWSDAIGERDDSDWTNDDSTYWSRLKRSLWSDDDNKVENSVLAPKHGSLDKFNNIDKPDGFRADPSLNYITGRPLFEIEQAHEQTEETKRRSNGAGDSSEDNMMMWGQFHDPVTEFKKHGVLKATCGNLTQNKHVLECFPKPDALNPCEDIMGAQWLRISVFVVVFLAVVGNVAVLVVLFSNCKEVTVTKFLMSNLAFADLCLGLYLLLIAAMDVHSIGEYFNYGYEWQYGIGCQAAGFLTVFASHLSVFTLSAITLERWFAITHAMHLNKRIRMRSALLIQLGGWSYSVLMSALPLFGVSNYSSTSICMPMEARDTVDVVYLVLIISNSGVAFCFIAGCYVQIYRSLGEDTRQAHGHAWRIEMTVTKKMTLLVFTNFACWAPIAFFGLTALAGMPFIDVAKSKILLVFFYPLNSCADPYLYAILTAQYRRDLFALLARCGLCKGKAPRMYDNNNSMPMLNHTNQTVVTRRSSSMDRSGASRKASRDFV